MKSRDVHLFIMTTSASTSLWITNSTKDELFSATCLISMTRLCYEHDVCLSVTVSVTLVDCDYTVQQKVEMGT